MIDRNQCENYIRVFHECRQAIPKATTSHVVRQIAERVTSLILKAKGEQPEFAHRIWAFKLECEDAVYWQSDNQQNDSIVKSLFQNRLTSVIERLIGASESFLRQQNEQSGGTRFPYPLNQEVPYMPGGATGRTSSASHSTAETASKSLSTPSLAEDLFGAEAEIRGLQDEIRKLKNENRMLLEEAERRGNKYNEVAKDYNQRYRQQDSLAAPSNTELQILRRRLEEEQQRAQVALSRVDVEQARAKKAEAERKVLERKVETVEAERKVLERQVEKLQMMQWDSTSLQSHLQNSMEKYPVPFRDFALELLKLAEQIGKEEHQTLTTRQDMERLDQYVYRPPLVNGWLAQEQENPVKLEDLLRVISLQDWVHRSLKQQGLVVIRPAKGDAFDPNTHNFTEQDLVWINDDRSLDNKIASVKRIGYLQGETVIRKADVKRYVFSDVGVASSLIPAKDLEPLDKFQEEMQAYLSSHGIIIIDPAHGEEFDPNYHNFTEQEPISAEKSFLDNKIAGVNRVGYRQGEMVLRKADVKRYSVVAEPPLRQSSKPDALDPEKEASDQGYSTEPEIEPDPDISSGPAPSPVEHEVSQPQKEPGVQEALQTIAPSISEEDLLAEMLGPTGAR